VTIVAQASSSCAAPCLQRCLFVDAALIPHMLLRLAFAAPTAPPRCASCSSGCCVDAAERPGCDGGGAADVRRRGPHLERGEAAAGLRRHALGGADPLRSQMPHVLCVVNLRTSFWSHHGTAPF
jgi:hypothetical protein